MAIISDQVTVKPRSGEIDYPTSDGRPMGETDLHRNIMAATIETLKLFYAGQRVYVSGNILLYYHPGNRRRHVSPDVLVAKGLDQRDRDHYLLWQEGRPPHVVIEVTSESTRDEDMEDKFEIYRDKVRVAEYFLYDPRGDYLVPALQGYRLLDNEYMPIESVAGRLPSSELGLHLEDGRRQLRFFDPLRDGWLPTGEELRRAAEAERQQAEAERQQAEAERRHFEAAWRQVSAEAEQMRQELEALRRRLGP